MRASYYFSRFSRVLLTALPLLCPLAAQAADTAQVGKVLSADGNLKNVVIMTEGILFYVSPTGQIEKVVPDPKQAASSKPQALQPKYQGYSTLTGSRQLVAVNDVTITYYSMMGQRPMGVTSMRSNPYGSRTNNTPTYNGNSLAQSMRNRSFSAGPNGSSNTKSDRKVRSIGDVAFTYYNENSRSGNGGKINRVGNYRITYYNSSDLSGRGGKMKSFSE